MHRNSVLVAAMACATVIVVSSMLSRAGNLNPPLGPVVPTGPTIIDSLPFTIDTPGAYVLRSNLVGTADPFGITVNASDVTIDLGGFSLIGTPQSASAIGSNASIEGLRIDNGTITDWPQIDVAVAFSLGTNISDVRVRDCAVGGVWAGQGAVLERITTSGGGFGIRTDWRSVLDGCNTAFHTVEGILTADACMVRHSTSSSNGSHGIEVGGACVVAECTAINNTGDGIRTGAGSTVTSCSAGNNGGAGIFAASESTVTQCSALGNTGDGVFGQFGVTVDTCTATENGDDGIRVSTGGSVRDCTARRNGGDGIELVTNCIAIGNNCSANGQDAMIDGAGVHVTSMDCRVESNHLVNNDLGIALDNGGTYIADNTVKGSVIDNYGLAAGNMNNVLLCELGEVFDQPASIRMGGTLFQQGDQNGIASTGPGTTPAERPALAVDLNGHGIIGTSDTGGTGILFNVGMVRNGFVRKWAFQGASLGRGNLTNIIADVNGHSPTTPPHILTTVEGAADRCIAIDNLADLAAIRAQVVENSVVSSFLLDPMDAGDGIVGGVIRGSAARGPGDFTSTAVGLNGNVVSGSRAVGWDTDITAFLAIGNDAPLINAITKAHNNE